MTSTNNQSSQQPNLKSKSKPKPTILERIICGMKIAEGSLEQIYQSLAHSASNAIDNIDMNNKIKEILQVKQMIFLFVLFTNYWLINNMQIKYNYSFASIIKCFVFYLTIILFYLILVMIILIKTYKKNDVYIQQQNELESYATSQNSEISNNKCEICNIIRCMRSFHCYKCNKCVSKYEKHSEWFNTCIGSTNCLIYILLLQLIFLYYSLSAFNILIQIILRVINDSLVDIKGKEFAYHLWFVILLYLNFKLFSLVKLFCLNALNNITEYEYCNWKRLPYLWKNMRKEYFNAFNKGKIVNMRELWVSFVNSDLSEEDKINIKLLNNKNLTKSEENNNDNDNDIIVEINDTKNNKDNCIEPLVPNEPTDRIVVNDAIINVNVDPFFSEDNKTVYYQISGSKREIINWTKIRLFTVFDLKNSPLREILIKTKIFSKTQT